jgi:hypothetical protein
LTLPSLRRVEADDATLLRRASRGDRRARRLFARRHAQRAVYLVGLLVDSAADATQLAAAALDAAIEAGVPGDDALVRAVAKVAAAGGHPLNRLALALTDVEERSEQAAADLLGTSLAELAKLRADARAELGTTALVNRDCRGWALATRRDRLTDQERDAANGHLMLCRPCRVRLDEQRRTRDKLRISGAVVTAVVVADVVSLATPGGGGVTSAALSSFAVGKTGAALAGAAILAVGAASTSAAVVRHSPARHAVVRHVDSDDTASSRLTAPPAPNASAAPRSRAKKAAVVPARSLVPSMLPSSLPTVSLPIPLPTPAVTLPAPLPTTVTTLVPLPTPSLSLSAPPLPTSQNG